MPYFLLLLFSHIFVSIENVEVHGVDGKVRLTPNISPRLQTASVEYINRCIGVQVPSENIVSLLNRMSLPAELVGQEVRVSVPPTRSGIIHFLACPPFHYVLNYGEWSLAR